MQGVYCNITTFLCSKILGYHQNCSTVCTAPRSVPVRMQSPTDLGWENKIPNIHSQGNFSWARVLSQVTHDSGNTGTQTQLVLGVNIQVQHVKL